jgi:hypothetical protein
MSEPQDPRLEQLVAPPTREGFHAELWQRTDAGERSFRRRRRLAIFIAVGAVLATASSAAMSRFDEQAKPIDQTISCPIPSWGGVNPVRLLAQVIGPPVPGSNGVPRSGAVYLTAANPNGSIEYAGVGSTRPKGPVGHSIDNTICRSAPAIALSRSGLHLVAVVRGTHGAQAQQECWLAPRISVRLQVKVVRGTRVAAVLAVSSGRALRPVAYVAWTPTLVRVWAAPSCEH